MVGLHADWWFEADNLRSNPIENLLLEAQNIRASLLILDLSNPQEIDSLRTQIDGLCWGLSELAKS
jgi:hypothetical protein